MKNLICILFVGFIASSDFDNDNVQKLDNDVVNCIKPASVAKHDAKVVGSILGPNCAIVKDVKIVHSAVATDLPHKLYELEETGTTHFHVHQELPKENCAIKGSEVL